MKQVQKVWAELSKANKGTKLSAKKRNAKLSVIDDVERSMSELEGAYQDLTYFTYEMLPELSEKAYDVNLAIDEMIINSEMMYAKDAGEGLLMNLERIEETASSLGIDPQEVFDQFDEAKEMAEDAIRAHEDLVKAWSDERTLQAMTSFANRIK
jgi:hypothetical protein